MGKEHAAGVAASFMCYVMHWSGLVTLVFTANAGRQGEMSQYVIILDSLDQHTMRPWLVQQQQQQCERACEPLSHPVSH